jgi:hypothetical protein
MLGLTCENKNCKPKLWGANWGDAFYAAAESRACTKLMIGLMLAVEVQFAEVSYCLTQKRKSESMPHKGITLRDSAVQF